MHFRRCGNSGIQLPALSLGLWHNFGSVDSLLNAKRIVRTAFDAGVTHFDLANNYGPSFGSAEENFGHILKDDLVHYRDELFISTKAGYDMWPGPYGYGGSRKYLVSSLDQSLQRLGLEYVDVFYHHCPDIATPLEETARALDYIVRSGRALYVGLSNYNDEQTKNMAKLLDDLGTPCLIQQSRYSMFDRNVEEKLLDKVQQKGIGFIAFSPLAQGLLTDRYLTNIPEGSRASKGMTYLGKNEVTALQPKIIALNEIAQRRGQSLSQMALSWLLKDQRVSSVLIGASSPEQLEHNLHCLNDLHFDESELNIIKAVLMG
ncbi:aldo/keto reductase [Alteromonas sp. 5E99-2]|nr:aldo/keto reductase [Alteromonas sp. 5E99-2]MBO1256196.1 aldo/keto reductase [Alteromonas sp. 5E99-2]